LISIRQANIGMVWVELWTLNVPNDGPLGPYSLNSRAALKADQLYYEFIRLPLLDFSTPRSTGSGRMVLRMTPPLVCYYLMYCIVFDKIYVQIEFAW